MQVAVVGLGAMGYNHARVAQSLGLLAGAADPDPDRRGAAEAAFGCTTHADPARAWADADAVVIATPTSTHHDLASLALADGKHVLVEKPMAPTAAEALSLQDAAREAGRCLAVGHIERHNPVVAYAHRALSEGRLGDLLGLSCRRLSRRPARIADVGCILDIGIHEIDIVRYLGGEVEQVHAITHAHGGPHEEQASILLRLSGDVAAHVETNWLTPRRVRRATLTGSECLLDLDYMEQRAWFSTSEQPTELALFGGIEYLTHQAAIRKEEPLRRELLDFVAAAGSGRGPLVTAHDGVMAVAVAEAALRSARTRRAVDLEAP